MGLLRLHCLMMRYNTKTHDALRYKFFNHSNMQKIGFSISILYYSDLSSFRVLRLFSALYCSMPQLDSCVPACNYELEALVLLSYCFGVYRNLLEHANFLIFFSKCEQRKLRQVCALAKIRPSLRCFKMRQIPNILISFSRLTQAAKAQAGLCIGILLCLKMR